MSHKQGEILNFRVKVYVLHSASAIQNGLAKNETKYNAVVCGSGKLVTLTNDSEVFRENFEYDCWEIMSNCLWHFQGHFYETNCGKAITLNTKFISEFFIYCPYCSNAITHMGNVKDAIRKEKQRFIKYLLAQPGGHNNLITRQTGISTEEINKLLELKFCKGCTSLAEENSDECFACFYKRVPF